MQLHLKEQTVVVIGSARGIGLATAAEFLREGANVALADIAADLQSQSESLVQEFGQQVATFHVDATDGEQLRALEENVTQRWSPCRHLVYAAGMGSGKYGYPFWNVPADDWQRVLQVNLIGAVQSLHTFAPAMVQARAGTALFLSSIAGQIGSQTDPPYSAAKAGLVNFAQCAAKDLAPYDVRVNAIAPGMIRTRLNRSVWQAWHERQPVNQQLDYDAWAESKIQAVTPLGRWQEPEDVAALAVFLASDRAKNMTGQTINVDGGQVMR